MNASALALLLTTTGCSLYFGGPSERAAGEPSTAASDSLPARCDAPEVDVFGIYEARSDHGPGPGEHQIGEAGVTIDRPGVHKLVLSAYEPKHWHVTLTLGASLESI